MISLLCPTRKRFNELDRMWHSALHTADDPDNLELVVYVDLDDKTTRNNICFLEGTVKEVLQEKEEIYSNLHNICASNAKGDIFFGAADDLIFRTRGWDTSAISAFDSIEDKIAFIFPNDGHWKDKLGTHGFFHRNWFNALGYLSPPFFSVDYSDNYVNDLANMINRRIYLGDNILIEHMHWTFNKSDFDETAKEAHIRRQNTNNSAIFNSDTVQYKKQQDANKLMEAMYG